MSKLLNSGSNNCRATVVGLHFGIQFRAESLSMPILDLVQLTGSDFSDSELFGGTMSCKGSLQVGLLSNLPVLLASFH